MDEAALKKAEKEYRARVMLTGSARPPAGTKRSGCGGLAATTMVVLTAALFAAVR